MEIKICDFCSLPAVLRMLGRLWMWRALHTNMLPNALVFVHVDMFFSAASEYSNACQLMNCGFASCCIWFHYCHDHQCTKHSLMYNEYIACACFVLWHLPFCSLSLLHHHCCRSWANLLVTQFRAHTHTHTAHTQSIILIKLWRELIAKWQYEWLFPVQHGNSDTSHTIHICANLSRVTHTTIFSLLFWNQRPILFIHR